MGKTYIDTLKYLVYGELEIAGLVEKPDVVGAIFGQTEGLLGDELDLRDLQKNGRIGRIDVKLTAKGGKTTGTIKLPSSLDMVETCILGAALETVDRVGPYEAKVKTYRVEDTRNMKRKVIVGRAKSLLKGLLNTEIPDSKEISDLVRAEVKTAEITTYGVDKLSAGPNINRYDSVVLVEGRADVLNLLKNDIPNVVAIGGANVKNDTVVKICREKESTLFLDGDRGGDLILNQLSRVAEIDFVARAPVGKEVEELTRKEMIKCLRNKIPYEQDEIIEGPGEGTRTVVKKSRTYTRSTPRPATTRTATRTPMARTPIPKTRMPAAVKVQPTTEKKEIPSDYSTSLEELENTLRARFYDSGKKCIKEMPVRDMIKNLEKEEKVETVIFDGIITQRLVDLSAESGVKRLIGIKTGNVRKKPEGLEVMAKD